MRTPVEGRSLQKSVALTMGDRYGVGPELVARLLADWPAGEVVTPVLFGDPEVFARGCAVARVAPRLRRVASPADARGGPGPAFVALPFDAPVGLPGHVSAAAGGEVLATLERVIAAAGAGDVDGLVYAPLNKQAMREAGHDGGDETAFFARRLGGEAGEINMLGEIWTSRVTSHVPLARVAELVTGPAIGKAIAQMHAFLRSLGVAEPRLAVAALNPHAGEGGAFGREEIDVIAPAIAAARAAGMAVEGPFPADSVFPQVLKGGFHGIVTMYHDQGQIALKLLGLGRGVTVIAGLPIPITTAGHGTAFDIAGKGIATVDGLAAAAGVCRRMLEPAAEAGSPTVIPR
jgi:4-hydroxy-L-threonine phosphate dehydrogenase PdxA